MDRVVTWNEFGNGHISTRTKVFKFPIMGLEDIDNAATHYVLSEASQRGVSSTQVSDIVVFPKSVTYHFLAWGTIDGITYDYQGDFPMTENDADERAQIIAFIGNQVEVHHRARVAAGAVTPAVGPPHIEVVNYQPANMYAPRNVIVKERAA